MHTCRHLRTVIKWLDSFNLVPCKCAYQYITTKVYSMNVLVTFKSTGITSSRVTDWDKLTKQLLNHFTVTQVINWRHRLDDGLDCKATLINGIKMHMTIAKVTA